MCVKFHSENLNPNFTPYAPQELCNYGMTITPRVYGDTNCITSELKSFLI